MPKRLKSRRQPAVPGSPSLSPGRTWIRRLGSARSRVRYVDGDGKLVTDARVIARIESLRVPPAWRDVHIARSPSRAIQAWGFDARGRKQYRYHERAVEQRDLRKYHRMRHLAKDLPRIRKQLREDASSLATRDAVAALVLRLISETFCRVGGERYLRENGTYGITTVKKSHLAVQRGAARIDYRGKGSIPQRQVVGAPDLVALLTRLRRSPGARLFRYADEGEWRNLTAHDVNEYVRRVLGSYSAKDFRTWGGTLRAATVLAELGPAKSPQRGSGTWHSPCGWWRRNWEIRRRCVVSRTSTPSSLPGIWMTATSSRSAVAPHDAGRRASICIRTTSAPSLPSSIATFPTVGRNRVPERGSRCRVEWSAHVAGVAERIPARLGPDAQPMRLVPDRDAVGQQTRRCVEHVDLLVLPAADP